MCVKASLCTALPLSKTKETDFKGTLEERDLGEKRKCNKLETLGQINFENLSNSKAQSYKTFRRSFRRLAQSN